MILLLGLDGATFDLLNPWFAQGALPHLARLKNQGSAGILQSTLPPVTAPAWASFLTGKHPHHHGVLDYFAGRAGEYRMISGNDIRGQTVWDILSAYGKTVGVLNVPMTYPPRAVNGFLIPGLPTPDSGQTHPAGFLTPYERELGPYAPFPKVVYQAG
ncbi:MAG TPA: alkaline phosphatase family protein, partial [Anaerolineales bacterium]|nr:alkaline phosphatase family protein [Anaerolineales bacterium]